MAVLLGTVSWCLVSATQVIIWYMRRATNIACVRTAVIVRKTGVRKRYKARLFSHHYTKLTCRTFLHITSSQLCLVLTSGKQYKVQEVQPTGTELVLSRSLSNGHSKICLTSSVQDIRWYNRMKVRCRCGPSDLFLGWNEIWKEQLRKSSFYCAWISLSKPNKRVTGQLLQSMGSVFSEAN